MVLCRQQTMQPDGIVLCGLWSCPHIGKVCIAILVWEWLPGIIPLLAASDHSGSEVVL